MYVCDVEISASYFALKFKAIAEKNYKKIPEATFVPHPVHLGLTYELQVFVLG